MNGDHESSELRTVPCIRNETERRLPLSRPYKFAVDAPYGPSGDADRYEAQVWDGEIEKGKSMILLLCRGARRV